MQLLFTISSLKRYGAGPIWVIMPFGGYSRQDKTRKGHQDSIAAEDFAILLKAAGAVGVTVIEMHSESGLNLYKQHFNGNAYSLDPTALYQAHLTALNLHDPVVGGPDHGAISRAKLLATALGVKTFEFGKEHDKAAFSATKVVSFNGDVAGHDTIQIDDMIDTGGTIINSGIRLKEENAKNNLVCAAHFVGSNNALERLLNTKTPDGKFVINHLVITDTIDLEPRLQTLERQYPAIRTRVSILSVGSILNEHINTKITTHPEMQPII